jgi:DNA (cytosine-5)-methyltransferase 1
MNVLDLFSGIGGFSIGLEAAGMKTVAFCEYDKQAQKVLKKNWPNTPIFDDVRTLNKDLLNAQGIKDVGLICGGYPCQPFSLAGERRGAKDDRHLWPEMFRLVQELRPTWVIGENVAGHITMGLDEVLADLESENYTARPFVIPACAIDAPHRRDRVWTIAHANSDSKSDGSINEQRMVANTECGSRWDSESLVGRENHEAKWSQDTNSVTGSSKNVAYAYGSQRQGNGSAIRARTEYPYFSGPSRWKSEPSVGRVADGVPNRSHRLKQLGNAVVPQVVQVIGEMIMAVEAN